MLTPLRPDFTGLRRGRLGIYMALKIGIRLRRMGFGGQVVGHFTL